ncbi:hypothetical protein PN441_12765 [Spirulina major CS-329]|uniref:hypothetical protein n=1 Tax=Spirulina TaxID=1154 RepID=UPI00232F0608|nr:MULTISPECIES: hypothetical protein [Spirulina]MDB9494406.1 hypothetical protein [Spirulina subsalsa CS-330]MDB9503941.1 hypothetical protein [Spirulina major CS-329]
MFLGYAESSSLLFTVGYFWPICEGAIAHLDRSGGSPILFANLFRGLARRQFSLIQTAGGQLELLYRRNYRQPTYSPKPAQPYPDESSDAAES